MKEQPTVLIIDDDPTHLYVTRELLEDEGLRVYCHEGAFGATRRFTEVNPDLVLLDVNMPGLAGDTLANIMRGAQKRRQASGRHRAEREREVPIVLFSSNDEDSLRNSVIKFGLSGYICKGDLGALRDRVRRFLAA